MTSAPSIEAWTKLMSKLRIASTMILLATALGCEHGRPSPQPNEVFCSQKYLITAGSPRTDEWEVCVEGWRTIAGVDLEKATGAEAPAESARLRRGWP
jgi:hypothetical protein